MQIRNTLPEYGNPFYNTTDVGGYSLCILGQPVCDGRNVLANCVGYACGRFNEIIGSMKYPRLYCDAQNFIEQARNLYPDLQITDYPTLGGIMVFSKIGEDYGHVMIVEQLIDGNTIYTSESAWHGKPFFNAHRYKSSNWSMSGYQYLGNIVNPAIGDVHWVDPTPTPTPTGDKLYKVVGGNLLLLNEGKASIGEYPTGTIVKYIRDGYNLQYQGRTYHYYYVEVTTDGKQGYMASEYLEPYNEPQPQPTPSKNEYEVIGGNLLLLDKNYASIGSYPTGTRVEYLEDGYNLKDQDGIRTYHYYKVRVETDGNVGYMASEYLKKI